MGRLRELFALLALPTPPPPPCAPPPPLFFKDEPSCIPQCNPFKLGHTLDIANMYRGMQAAQREVGVPSGSFTQTQSCAQLRLTGGCNTCGKF